MNKQNLPTVRKTRKIFSYSGSIHYIGIGTLPRLPSSSFGPVAPYGTHVTIVDLIENQVRQTPNNIAIRFEGQCLTYLQCNRLANSLAHKLQKAGIRKGDFVPLLFENCLAYPVSLLALMKMGAVFVPLDTEWGEQRLVNVLEQLAPKLVLTNQISLQGYPCWHIDLDMMGGGAEPPNVEILQSDAIYGFFTSGSTGTPKCAINIHKGIVNRFLDMTRRYGICATDQVLVNSKLAFDSTLWQLLWPLTAGLTTVLPRPWRLYDLNETIRLIDTHQITMTDFVPSIFNLLVDDLVRYPQNATRLSSLRQVLIGGEEINFRSIKEFRKLLPQVGLANTYGVTECSMGMIFYQVGNHPQEPVPIGRPINNTFVIILDKQFRPVTDGKRGELFLGGDCLGAGYLNAPQKTKAVFIDNPFEQLPGDRLYRTGDFGYLDSNGQLQFVGRQDRQVQINGNRVELGEIEAVLNRHPAVKQAKVVHTGNRQTKRLAAALVTTRQVKPKSLKSFLAAHLPAYMCPRRFLFLPELPLNANGKVDYARLTRIFGTASSRNNPMAETLSESEQQLAAIWHELLGVENIEPQSHFFELGGDSILAINLLARIEVTFGKRLEITELMQTPTFASMSRLVIHTPEADHQKSSRRHPPAYMLSDLSLCNELSRCHVSELSLLDFDHVLLTGATGFIGVHLLDELLRQTHAKIYCLVRAGDLAGARERIENNLCFYHLPATVPAARIVVLPADLARPRLGLTDDQYGQLTDSIDTIFHCAAMVNFAYSYGLHRPVNVLGTAELLKLAAVGCPKRFHYVSTLGVFPLRRTFRQGRLTTENCLPDPRHTPDGGYYQSKTVAENLVAAVRSRGITTTIFRLGEIMPHSASGIANPKALFNILLKSFFSSGVYPRSDRPIDYTPVDYAVRAMLQIARQPEWLGTNFHICHSEGVSMNALMEQIGKALHRCKPVELSQFEQVLAAELARRPHGDLSALAFLMKESRQKKAIRNQSEPDLYDDMFMTTMVSICRRKLRKALSESPIRCPHIDGDIVRPYGIHLSESVSQKHR